MGLGGVGDVKVRRLRYVCSGRCSGCHGNSTWPVPDAPCRLEVGYKQDFDVQRNWA